ncbi:phage major capsid protein [Bradyrhizobium japonicum]|uniref:phage major capsid family protein n=1 Tax=Bradyrhizobium japonicum TaxID=375 RepID=UPI001BA7BCA5|nr:phage major capsid protein [Bradyrhizobium japonicum]MBR0732418.1 phage major capsid protein [Bradyrhizobium japonicum]
MSTALLPARQGIPLRVDRDAAAREWRNGFVRSATVTTLSLLRKAPAGEIEREIRSPVSPMKVGDYPGSSVVRLLTLAPKSAAAQLVPLATVVDLKGISSFSFPLPTNFAAASFVGEGQPIPVRQGVFAGMPVGPVKKLALISALSAELESASGDVAQTIIAHTLEVAVGKGLDAVLFSDDAATADAPAGLLFGVTPITPVAGGGFTAMSGDLRALIDSIAAAGIDTSGVVFVCAPSQALAIELTAGPHFAHRIIEASSLAAGTVIAIATSGLVISGDGADPVIDTSKQALLHFADPASQISTPGTPNVVSVPTVSTFQADLLALRCIARITWSAAPGSVAVVNGATW